jgi:hypothetical protein
MARRRIARSPTCVIPRARVDVDAAKRSSMDFAL